MRTMGLASRRALAFLSLPVAVAACIVACSGKTVSDVGGGGEGGAGTNDGGPGPRPADCPSSLPDQGTTCTKNDLLCEYGDDYNPLCNKVVVCSSGKWASPIYYGGGADKCPSSPPSVPVNPPSCPATRSAIPEGQACAAAASPGSCSYDTGSTCSCGVHCANYPIRQPDCNPDAGITTSCCDTSKVTWGCFDGPPYCPTPRPRVGTSCDKEGAECAIDAPQECGQTTMGCHDGVWNVENTSCPISTARAKHDIRYVEPSEEARLKDDLLKVRLAEYRYKSGEDSKHLGFIIEDMPEGSPAVLASRDRVDLYGYVSMSVATIKQQQREIDELRAEIAQLREQRDASGAARRPGKSTLAGDRR